VHFIVSIVLPSHFCHTSFLEGTDRVLCDEPPRPHVLEHGVQADHDAGHGGTLKHCGASIGSACPTYTAATLQPAELARSTTSSRSFPDALATAMPVLYHLYFFDWSSMGQPAGALELELAVTLLPLTRGSWTHVPSFSGLSSGLFSGVQSDTKGCSAAFCDAGAFWYAHVFTYASTVGLQPW
jgi:hypothetical protein